MESIILLILAFFIIAGIFFIIDVVRTSLLFKKGNNPFHRICKKCGAHQIMYQSNVEGFENDIWWEEVYPIGDNPDCKCHKKAEYRP